MRTVAANLAHLHLSSLLFGLILRVGCSIWNARGSWNEKGIAHRRALACVAFIALVQLGVQYGRVSGMPPADNGLGVVLHRRLLSGFPAWDWSWLAAPRAQWAM
jgi:hypothetical protein